MIGGNSAGYGSGWSFFRSSSSSSQSSRQSQARANASDSNSITPSDQSISILPPIHQHTDSPESGNQYDNRSSSGHDDLQSVQAGQDGICSRHDMLPKESALTWDPSSTPEASTSRFLHSQASSTLEGDDQAPPLASGSGTSNSASGHGASPPIPPYHLHSLTERKLEKAVLGRAVGLRQLVLLSNAFATRPAAPPPPAASRGYSYSSYPDEHSLRYPHASTSRSIYEDEELDAGVIDYEEDEAERKRREEDWLDSMLDEMLTDAEDDDEDEDKQEAEQASISLDRRVPSRSEREFKEPYVHLSIKYTWHTTQQSSSASVVPPSSATPTSSCTGLPHQSLLAQHAAMLEDQTSESAEHLETAPPSLALSEQWLGDSGFMEPYTIPIPESADASPNSSANSQASDDDGLEEGQLAYENDEKTAHESPCEECEASNESCKEADGQDHVRYQVSEASNTDIGIPISSQPSHRLSSPRSYTSLSLPELAYSANSFNTLSSSPSHSINLFTPGTSPPPAFMQAHLETPTSAELEKQAWEQQRHHEASQVEYEYSLREAQEVMLPMDDLDLYDDEDEEVEERRSSSSRGDEDGSSNGSSTSSDDTTRLRRTRGWPSSLELVRYLPSESTAKPKEAEQEDTALRIPLYCPLSHYRHAGLFSTRSATTMGSPGDSPAMPALPPSLLSVMMGKSPVVQVEVPSSHTKTTAFYHSADGGQTQSDRNDKLRLPMFLPSEIVKSLYDSVDFGLPPRFSSTSSPSVSQLQQHSTLSQSPHFDLASHGGTSLTPHHLPTHSPTSARSAPNSPRSRCKSLTQADPLFPASSHTSPGGLLFSSLGLFASRDEHSCESRSFGRMWDQGYASERRRSHSSIIGVSSFDTFTHSTTDVHSSPSGGSDESSTRRARRMLHSHTRNESRSPSRLRLLVDQGDTFADDFEFGTI